MTEVFEISFNKLSIIYLITDNCVKSKKYKVHNFKNRLRSISGLHFDFSKKKKKIYRLLCILNIIYQMMIYHYDYLRSNSIK